MSTGAGNFFLGCVQGGLGAPDLGEAVLGAARPRADGGHSGHDGRGISLFFEQKTTRETPFPGKY